MYKYMHTCIPVCIVFTISQPFSITWNIHSIYKYHSIAIKTQAERKRISHVRLRIVTNTALLMYSVYLRIRTITLPSVSGRQTENALLSSLLLRLASAPWISIEVTISIPKKSFKEAIWDFNVTRRSLGYRDYRRLSMWGESRQRVSFYACGPEK